MLPNIVFSILAIISHSEAVERQLLVADVLYRHGDRTPINPYPNDPYKDVSNWPVGFGQLTPKGKMMHYRLGQYLRRRYDDLIGQQYNESEIYVRSTDVDRTLMSALSNLAGLYPPSGAQVWNPDLAWQPIPVHTIPLEQDSLLSNRFSCPRFEKLFEELLVSEDITNINKKYQWVYDYVTENTGRHIQDLTEIDYIADTLFVETQYNKTLPDWTHKVFPQPMVKMQSYSFLLSTWTHEMKRLRGGPLIKNIFERMTAISETFKQNGTVTQHKMMMYSAHDTTIAYLLNSLGLYDPPIPPPYASCIMMELFHNNEQQDFEIRILFRNDTGHEPYVMRLCDGNEYCSIKRFEEKTRDLRPLDWNTECQLNDVQDPVIWIVTFASLCLSVILFFVLMISVIIALVRRKRFTKQNYVENFDYAPITSHSIN